MNREIHLTPMPIGHRPMGMSITKSDLVDLINGQLKAQGDPEIPQNAVLTVEIPSGGDWSGTDLEFDDNKVLLEVKWKT